MFLYSTVSTLKPEIQTCFHQRHTFIVKGSSVSLSLFQNSKVVLKSKILCEGQPFALSSTLGPVLVLISSYSFQSIRDQSAPIIDQCDRLFTDSRDGGDDFSELQFVQDGRLSSCVQAD